MKVRHILCEKHSKIMEALEKIKGDQKFEQVRRAPYARAPVAGLHITSG